MKPMRRDLRIKAFSLQELLIVLIIIGILVLLALPNLMPLVVKAKSTEAQIQLKHLATLQRANFLQYSRYSDDMAEIGFEQARTVEEGGTANYRIEIVQISGNAYRAQATAVVDFDGDGIYNVWEVNESGTISEVVKD